jgi:hypothetical protein
VRGIAEANDSNASALPYDIKMPTLSHKEIEPFPILSALLREPDRVDSRKKAKA